MYRSYLRSCVLTLSLIHISIILTSTLAKRTDAEIIKGFGGREKEDEALIKSRFYLSYIPEEVKDGDTSKKENDNKKQVLSSQTEYHHLTAIIDKYVYLSINPDLKDYLEDPTTNLSLIHI